MAGALGAFADLVPGLGDEAGALQSVVTPIETGGQADPNTAVSPKGAVGKNQITPDTAVQYGYDPAKLTDPDYNDQAYRTIMADLLNRYNGDKSAALAAYNAGPRRGDQYVKAGDDPSVLPKETQGYLAKAGMTPAPQQGGALLVPDNLTALPAPEDDAGAFADLVPGAGKPAPAGDAGAFADLVPGATPAPQTASLDAPMAAMGPGDYTSLTKGSYFFGADGAVYQKGTAPGGKDAFIKPAEGQQPGIMDTMKQLFPYAMGVAAPVVTGLKEGPRPNPNAPETSGWDTVKDIAARVIPNLKSTAGGMLESAAETPAQPNIPISEAPDNDPAAAAVANMGKTLAKTADVKGTPANIGKTMFREAQAHLKENLPNVPQGSLKDIAFQVADGMTQMAIPMAASFATKSPLPALTGFGAQAYAEGYGDARARGAAPEDAQSAGLFSAAATTIPATLPLHAIMKPGGTFLGKTLSSAGAMGLMNMMTTALQKAYDAGIIGTKMTWGEAVKAMGQSGLVGFVTGGLFGAGGHAVEKVQQARADRAAAAAQPKVEPGPASTAPPPEPEGAPPAPEAPTAASVDKTAPNSEPVAAAPAQPQEGPAPVPMRGPEPFKPVFSGKDMFQTGWRDAAGNTFDMRDPRVIALQAKGPQASTESTAESGTSEQPSANKPAAAAVTPDAAAKALETNIDPRTGQRPKGNAALRDFRAEMKGIVDGGNNVSRETKVPVFKTNPGALQTEHDAEVAHQEAMGAKDAAAKLPPQDMANIRPARGFDPGAYVDEARAAQIGREKPFTAAQLGQKLGISGPRAARVLQAVAKAPADPGFEGAVDYVRQARAAQPKGESLFDAIRRHGGISDAGPEGGDLRQIMLDYKNPPFKPKLLNPNGLKPDAMRQALQDEGWFGTQDRFGADAQPTGSYRGDDLQDLYDLMDKEARGEKVYAPESTTALDLHHRAMMDEELGRAGIGAGDSDAVAARKLLAWRKENATSIPEEHHAKIAEAVGGLGDEAQAAARKYGYEPLDATEEPEERASPEAGGGRSVRAAGGPEEAGRSGRASGRGDEILDDVPFARRPGPRGVGRDESSGFDFERGSALDGQGRPVDQLINEAGAHSAKQLAAAREAQGHGKIAPKAPQKSAGPLFGNEEPEEHEEPKTKDLFDLKRRGEEPFYSALTRNIEEMKQEKAPASQWSSIIDNLKSKGVKQEEIDWSGIKEWLGEQKGPVSKAALLDHLRENEVNVQEVTRGGPRYDETKPDEQAVADHAKEWEKIVGLIREAHDDIRRASRAQDNAALMRAESRYSQLMEEQDAIHAEMVDETWERMKERGEASSGEARYRQYALPGGENYREMLLTLPERGDAEIERLKQAKEAAHLNLLREFEKDAGLERHEALRLTNGVQHGNTSSHGIAMMRQAMGTEKADRLRQEVYQAQRAYDKAFDARKAQRFTHSHWGEPNVLAHVRFDERGGLTATPEQLGDIGDRIANALGIRKKSDMGSGAPDAAVANGAITKLEAAQFRHAMGWPGDTTGAKERILHIAEVQSDWHQRGRRFGYRGSPEDIDRLQRAANEAYDEMQGLREKKISEITNGRTKKDVLDSGDRATFKRLSDIEKDPEFVAAVEKHNQAVGALNRAKGEVPNAPFKTSWHELAMKRMLRYAAEHGYDRLSWDTGATNADRYDLSHQVQSIGWIKLKDGTVHIDASDPDGNTVINKEVLPKDLPDFVGKEIADKIMSDENRNGTVRGDDLKIGGEGMKGFYDRIVPQFMSKYVKKWGAKVEPYQINQEPSGFVQKRWDGPRLTAAWIERQILDDDGIERKAFKELPAQIQYQIRKAINLADRGATADEISRELSDRAAEFLGGRMTEEPTAPVGDAVHSVPITDAMRESVMQGQPLFQRGEGEAAPEESRHIVKLGKIRLSFNPEFSAKRAEIGDALRNRLDQLGLHDIALKVPDWITEEGAPGKNNASYVDGFYNPLSQSVFVAMDAKGGGVEHTLDHEAIHALKNLGVISDKEWSVLTAKAPEWIKKYQIDKTYADRTPEKQAEEAVAHAFPDWRKGKLGNSGNAVQRIFNKLKNFFEAIRSAMKGLGFQSADDIFKKIGRGEVGLRGLDEEGGAEEPSMARRRKGEEEKPDLIVQHNTTAENLRHADRMGGFAAPSLAITKADHPLDGFGGITLLGDKDMADPRGPAGTKVFGADIYSPRYPQISYKPDAAALKKINATLAPYRKEGEREIYGSDVNNADDLRNVDAFHRYAKAISGDEYPDHREIAKRLLEESGAPEKIFKGFDYNGNRRYTPHTLENVIRILKKEIRGGESFNYGVGSLRSKYTPQFRSLDQIRGAKNRLMSDADFKNVKDDIDEKFWDVARELAPHYKYNSNDFGYGDNVINMLGDAAKQGLYRAMKEYGFEDVPQEKIAAARDFLESLRHLPTEYFEGKILRGVGIHEFHTAVIPHDTKPETRALLEKHGLQTVEYKKDDRADRARAIKEAAEAHNLMFARRKKPEEPPKREISWLGKIDSAIGENVEKWSKSISDAASSVTPDSVKEAKAAVQMAISPMATGSPEARAAAKDFANSVRAAYERGSRNIAALKKQFSPEQMAKMWNAADEQSVAMQQGKDTKGIGYDRLTPAERSALRAMQADADTVMDQAIQIGLYKGEKLPSYAPRMAVALAADGTVDRLSYGGETASSLNAIGKNLRTTTPNLRQRKYLTAEETEAAAKHISPDAVLVRDIRTLPLATARLRQAVAGRSLINTIREIGNATGEDTVVEGAIPEGSEHKWFTIDHPAFKTYKPKMVLNEDENRWEPLRDENGNVILQKVPLYIRGDFEGPLRAVLRKDSGALYKAYMNLKAKSMSVIMYSPLMHNAVIWGKAVPAAPLKMINPIWKDADGKWHVSIELYGRGHQARMDADTMHEAIQHGVAPIGRHFAMQDVTGIMQTGEEAPGRSWTAKAMGLAARPFGKDAADRVKTFVDRAGDFWHNSMLWDRVADLQMGIYTLLRDRGIKEGMEPEAAKYYAAHFANRYAGALPMESMSQAATAWSNLMLFSRSFNGTNIGAYKDFLMGLPKDIQAQVTRDAGPDALQKIQGTARRKAAVMMMTDIALSHFTVYAAQMALALALGRAFFPPSQNEEGFENRVYLGKSGDGRDLYGRLPVGKVGEDFQDWIANPVGTGERKFSGLASWLQEIASNQDYWGNKIYDPMGAHKIGPWFKNFGIAAERLAEHMTPLSALEGAKDWLTNKGDPKTNALRSILPLFGITVSRGAPGGPEMGAYYKARDDYNYRLSQALPNIKAKVQAGDIAGAEKDLDALGVPRSQQRFILRSTERPGMTRGRFRAFQRFATPEQREEMNKARQRVRGDQHSELEGGLEDAIKNGTLSSYARSGATWTRQQAISAATAAGLPATAQLLRDARNPARGAVRSQIG